MKTTNNNTTTNNTNKQIRNIKSRINYLINKIHTSGKYINSNLLEDLEALKNTFANIKKAKKEVARLLSIVEYEQKIYNENIEEGEQYEYELISDSEDRIKEWLNLDEQDRPKFDEFFKDINKRLSDRDWDLIDNESIILIKNGCEFKRPLDDFDYEIEIVGKIEKELYGIGDFSTGLIEKNEMLNINFDMNEHIEEVEQVLTETIKQFNSDDLEDFYELGLFIENFNDLIEIEINEDLSDDLFHFNPKQLGKYELKN